MGKAVLVQACSGLAWCVRPGLARMDLAVFGSPRPVRTRCGRAAFDPAPIRQGLAAYGKARLGSPMAWLGRFWRGPVGCDRVRHGEVRYGLVWRDSHIRGQVRLGAVR